MFGYKQNHFNIYTLLILTGPILCHVRNIISSRIFTRVKALFNMSGFKYSAGHFVLLIDTVVRNWPLEFSAMIIIMAISRCDHDGC